MEFIEAPAFTRYLSRYLNDEAYRELQSKLAVNPDLGDVMPGTAALEKYAGLTHIAARAARGGLRIIYCHFRSDNQIWLVTLYNKNEASDLTAGEKKALKAAVEKETEIRARLRRAGDRQRRTQ